MRHDAASGILLGLFLAACVCCRAGGLENDGPATLPALTANPLLSGPHGNYEAAEPLAVWITDANTLATHYRRLRHDVLGGPEIEPPVLDFTREGVLLVGMGRQATAGYQVSLATTRVVVTQGIVEVRVIWREPEPGEITAQVLTSPFLLLRLPRDGITRIRVVDQHRRLKVEIGTE